MSTTFYLDFYLFETELCKRGDCCVYGPFIGFQLDVLSMDSPSGLYVEFISIITSLDYYWTPFLDTL